VVLDMRVELLLTSRGRYLSANYRHRKLNYRPTLCCFMCKYVYFL